GRNELPNTNTTFAALRSCGGRPALSPVPTPVIADALITTGALKMNLPASPLSGGKVAGLTICGCDDTVATRLNVGGAASLQVPGAWSDFARIDCRMKRPAGSSCMRVV